MIIASLMLIASLPQADVAPDNGPGAATKYCKLVTLPQAAGVKRKLICATPQEWAQYARWQEAEYRRARRDNFPISGL